MAVRAPRAARDAARKPPSTRFGEAAVPVAWANRRGRREPLPMPRIACGSPPARPLARPLARRIARAISLMSDFKISDRIFRPPVFAVPFSIVADAHDRRRDHRNDG